MSQMKSHHIADSEQSAESGGRIGVILGGLFVLYIFGYVALLLLGYFDLATLPWARRTDGWLFRVYEPIEWLRRLWL
jgi:hypothetical protein